MTTCKSVIFKRRAELVYTSVESCYELLECGARIKGTLYCNFNVGKAAFDTEEPIFFDYVRCIDRTHVTIHNKRIEIIEIYTYDDEFWQFRLL